MQWIALRLRPGDEAAAAEVAPPAGAADPAALAAPQHALAWWALQFTPRVALLEEAVVLEVAASLRLFGGRLTLHERLRREAPELGLPLAAVAWAPNSLAALTLARAGVVEGVADGDASRTLPTLLDPLPLTHLSVLATHRPLLARLGLKRLGEVRRLPRAQLARRVGPEVLLALDRLYGDLTEPAHAWVTVPERFALRRELRERVEHAPVLLHAAEPLLVQGCAWLAARHAGLRRFTLHWAHDALRARRVEANGSLTVATAHPTRQLTHLRRLLSEHLARTQLAAPVGEVALHIDEAVPLQEHSATLLPGSALQDDESLSQLLERMSVRLGPERVRRGRVEDDHRPERSQHWSPATLESQPPRATVPRPGSPQPSWLLEVPQRLSVVRDQPQYRGPLRLLAGPQRIEGGWWQLTPSADSHTQAQRDYFIAQSEQAGLLWIYAERLPQDEQGWFLHGFF